MSDLPDAVWVCAAATDEDPAVVGEHDHQVFGVTLEPEPRLLGQAEPASQERQLPPFGCAWSRSTARALACDVEDRAVLRDSCTAWRWDRVAAVIDQQLRARARSSSRKLTDLVREVVVQEAQRERVAALAMDDARGRVAEAEPRPPSRHCKQARTGLAQPTAALDRAQDVLDARERAAGRNDYPRVGAGEVVWADPSAPAAAHRHRQRGRAHGDLAGAVL
jgi:hypothetical protein